MDKRKVRDLVKLLLSIFFCWLYIPHILIGGGNIYVKSDVKRMNTRINLKMPPLLALLFFLHTNGYFRSLFYSRIGAVKSMLIGWYRPGDKYFTISNTLKMGEGCLIAHPFSTILNADSIGKNFACRHCTTLGAKTSGRPVLGDNVTLGASVTIIGHVHIGNNVIVGAGAVVVKDVPDNCIVAGNPAKVIRYL